MRRTEVVSSQIHSIGYSPETLTLEVQFKGKGDAPGPVYRYSDVQPEAHAALIGAESVGRHFGQNIRGKFRTEKVEPEKAEGAAQ